jgi:hypothetical protein
LTSRGSQVRSLSRPPASPAGIPVLDRTGRNTRLVRRLGASETGTPLSDPLNSHPFPAYSLAILLAAFGSVRFTFGRRHLRPRLSEIPCYRAIYRDFCVFSGLDVAACGDVSTEISQTFPWLMWLSKALHAEIGTGNSSHHSREFNPALQGTPLGLAGKIGGAPVAPHRRLSGPQTASIDQRALFLPAHGQRILGKRAERQRLRLPAGENLFDDVGG